MPGQRGVLLVGGEEVAHLVHRRRAGRGGPAGPRASRRPGPRRAAGRRGPARGRRATRPSRRRCSGSVSRRRQLGSCAVRSTRPGGHLAGRRGSWPGRACRPARTPRARPASARRGAPARAARAGVPQALGRPRRQTSRRWIAAARPDSISCSEIAQTSASNGSGRRRGRSHGLARITGPTSGSRRKRRWNSDRSWSVPSAKRMRSIAPERAVARGRLGADPHGVAGRPGARDHRLAAPRAAAARAAAPRRSSTPSRPGMRHAVAADGQDVALDDGRSGHRRRGYRSLRRCTSTRNERVAATSHLLAAARARPGDAHARPRAAQDPHEHEGGHAEQEAARWLPRSRRAP